MLTRGLQVPVTLAGMLNFTGVAGGEPDLLLATSFEDNEVCSSGCPPVGWQVSLWPTAIDYAACRVTRIYNVEPGAAYLFTTCTPPGAAAGTGDPVITSLTDNLGRSYSVANDDCAQQSQLPQLQGWSCSNDLGALTMACAPPSAQGVTALSMTFYMDLQICPFNAGGAGHSSLYIWFRGSKVPNPG